MAHFCYVTPFFSKRKKNPNDYICLAWDVFGCYVIPAAKHELLCVCTCA